MDIKQVVCPHCNALNRVSAGRLNEQPKCGACHRPLLDAQPLTLTAENFARHTLESDLPVVVDFWAAWCGPCRAMAPAFAQAAGELKTDARFAKVDTEAEPGLAGRYGIRGIPTLIMFRRGREVDRASGAMDRRSLVAWVRQRL